jgi:hypothetical protein
MTPGGLFRGQGGVGSLCEFFMTYSLGFLWSRKGAEKIKAFLPTNALFIKT